MSCQEKMLEKSTSARAQGLQEEDNDVLMDDSWDQPYSPAAIPKPPAMPSSLSPQPPSAQVKDVPEEDTDLNSRWIEEYPGAGKSYGRCQTLFDQYRDQQIAKGHTPWAPFENEAEWELAEWLMTSGVSQTRMDSFLKLQSVSKVLRCAPSQLTHLEKIQEGVKPKFHNKRKLLQLIDMLPSGPRWKCQPFQITGDEKDHNGETRTEDVELWLRDPVECIKELIENQFIGGKNIYSPRRVYRDPKQTNREYSETMTGDWCWDTQVC